MWYGACGGDGRGRICMAYSGDGGTWSKYDGDLDGVTDVILNLGPVGAWDYYDMCDPAVVKTGDIYFMWYTGWDAAQAGKRRIGLAYSMTSKSWTKAVVNPVLSVGYLEAWDSHAIGGVAVIQDRLDFKMWYTGWSSPVRPQIGYAENFMRMSGVMGLIEAPENTVYYIYPDYQGSKPAGTNCASLTDRNSLGMILSMSRSKQYFTADTDTSVVNPVTGEIIVSSRHSAMILGGPATSGPTKYYEAIALQTPVYFRSTGPFYHFYSRSTEAAIPGTSMIHSIVSTNQDMFVIMVFKQPSTGRHLLITYGYGWKGSYAAALWFKYGTGPYAFGRQGIPMLNNAYYIFKWIDANGDGSVDLSEITLVASGN